MIETFFLFAFWVSVAVFLLYFLGIAQIILFVGTVYFGIFAKMVLK